MKFLEGKTPAERNKIIAALVLGLLAFLAVSYTLSGFLFPAKTTTTAKSGTPTPAVAKSPGTGSDQPVDTASTSLTDVAWMLTTPVSYVQNAFGADSGRNVFAFYEPPPPTPYSPTPLPTQKPLPPATPTPTPPYGLAYVTPSSVYAGSKSFRLEAGGDKFDQDARIIFNGSELPTNFVSGQKLTADIPANLISGAGSPQIMVRNSDGTKYSLPQMLQVQQPPTPNYSYIGLIEKKHRDNDMAMLQEKGKTDVASYRLNDPVGDRFRLISISSREVVLEDRSLGFKYRVAFSDSKTTGGAANGGGANGSGLVNTPFGRGGQGAAGLTYVPYNGPNGPNGPNPTMVQPGEIPGIPANIQRAPQQTVRNPDKKRDYEDDNDDGGPNR